MLKNFLKALVVAEVLLIDRVLVGARLHIQVNDVFSVILDPRIVHQIVDIDSL